MAKRMYADTNKTVIYQNNNAVIDNPLGDINNVFFHSIFDYLAIQNKVRTNVTIPSSAGGTFNQWDIINAFAHGLSYKPTVGAYINNTGIQAPIVGTFVYSMEEGSGGTQIQQLYAVSNDTHVGILYGRTAKPATSLPSFVLDVTFFVYEEIP